MVWSGILMYIADNGAPMVALLWPLTACQDVSILAFLAANPCPRWRSPHQSYGQQQTSSSGNREYSPEERAVACHDLGFSGLVYANKRIALNLLLRHKLSECRSSRRNSVCQSLPRGKRWSNIIQKRKAPTVGSSFGRRNGWFVRKTTHLLGSQRNHFRLMWTPVS